MRMLTEAPITRGQKYLQQRPRNLHDEEAVAFARRKRFRDLPRLVAPPEEVPFALGVKSVEFATSGETQTKLTLTLFNATLARTVELTTSYSMGSAHLDPPAFWEVLGALLLDTSGIEYETFETWCENFGYEVDSRKAEATFNACRDTLPGLLRFLGNEAAEIRVLDEDALRERFASAPTFRLPSCVIPE